MKKLILLLFATITFYALCGFKKEKPIKNFNFDKSDSIPIPFKSINETIFIDSFESVEMFLVKNGTSISAIKKEDGDNYILLSNEKGNEYLRISCFPGNECCQFFEVGYIGSIKKEKFTTSNADKFFSEKDVKLGVTVNDFKKIVKSLMDYEQKTIGGYKIFSRQHGEIGHAYNEKKEVIIPEYIEEYLFYKNRLVRFAFGRYSKIPTPISHPRLSIFKYKSLSKD